MMKCNGAYVCMLVFKFQKKSRDVTPESRECNRVVWDIVGEQQLS
jgi:hypothetical protein